MGDTLEGAIAAIRKAVKAFDGLKGATGPSGISGISGCVGVTGFSGYSPGFSGFSGISSSYPYHGGFVGFSGISTHPTGKQPKYGIGQHVDDVAGLHLGIVQSYYFNTLSYVYKLTTGPMVEECLLFPSPGRPLVEGRWPEDAGLCYVPPVPEMTPALAREKELFLDKRGKLEKALKMASEDYNKASVAYTDHSRECKHLTRTRFMTTTMSGISVMQVNCADCGNMIGTERAYPLKPTEQPHRGPKTYDVRW